MKNNSINSESLSLTTDTFVNAGTVVVANTGLTVVAGGADITGNTIIDGGTVDISTDNAANAVTIGTGNTGRLINIGRSTGAHTMTIGNTNSTTSVDIASGTGNMILNSAGTNTITGTGGVTIQSTNTAIGVTSGTGAISISADAAATTVNIGTGAAAKTVTLGSTNGASTTAIRYGTADYTLASATGTVMSALDTGEITYPLQPAFSAVSAGDTDVTGDGTVYTIIFGTEIFDQNGDFDGTSTFTAPVTGRYMFSVSVRISGVLISHTSAALILVTSNRSYRLYLCSPFNLGETASGNVASTLGGTAFADMDAGDTATVTITVSGGTKVIDLTTTANDIRFSGYLVC